MRKIIPFILLVLLLYTPGVEGKDYISDPSNIPLIGEFDAPSPLKAGDSGFMNFSILNRYEGNMSSVWIIIELYEHATIDGIKNINDIHNPPLLEDGLNYSYNIENLSSSAEIYVQIPITTSSDTQGGIYFIRFHLTFKYNNTSYIMKSRGHFTKEDWESATREPISDIEDERYYVGKLNITFLDVDGIIPESSFSIENKEKPFSYLVFGIIGAFLFTFILSIFLILSRKKQYFQLKRSELRFLIFVIFVICLAVVLLFSWILWAAFPPPEQPTLDSTYNTAMYLRYKTTGSILVNDITLANNITRISGRHGFTNHDNEQDWVIILVTYCDDLNPDLIEEYGLEFAVENKQYYGTYSAYGRSYYSRFYVSLHEERYKVFENNDMNIWFVYSPRI